MAKTSVVNRDKKRRKMVSQNAAKRFEIKKKIYNKAISIEERYQYGLQLARMPKDGSKVRVRNRCSISGRPRGVYAKFMLSRSMLRDLASNGLIPGIIKSSW